MPKLPKWDELAIGAKPPPKRDAESEPAPIHHLADEDRAKRIDAALASAGSRLSNVDALPREERENVRRDSETRSKVVAKRGASGNLWNGTPVVTGDWSPIVEVGAQGLVSVFGRSDSGRVTASWFASADKDAWFALNERPLGDGGEIAGTIKTAAPYVRLRVVGDARQLTLTAATR